LSKDICLIAYIHRNLHYKNQAKRPGNICDGQKIWKLKLSVKLELEREITIRILE